MVRVWEVSDLQAAGSNAKGHHGKLVEFGQLFNHEPLREYTEHKKEVLDLSWCTKVPSPSQKPVERMHAFECGTGQENRAVEPEQIVTRGGFCAAGAGHLRFLHAGCRIYVATPFIVR